MPDPSSPAPVNSAPRFSWPVRVLLFLVLFHMFFRSTDVLYPWADWADELAIDRSPRALPTRKELTELCDKANGSAEPALDEFKKSFASLPRFWCPIPTEATQEKLTSPVEWLQYSLTWSATRLEWCECVLSINQEWPMFSPNVSRCNYPARARLFYADGTEITVRQRCDLEDFTSYLRWDKGKNLCFGFCVTADAGSRREACAGWCNFVAHQHPISANGSPLDEIRLYSVRYDFPPPEVEDVHTFLLEQKEKTRDHNTNSELVSATFFTYWPKTRQWRFSD